MKRRTCVCNACKEVFEPVRTAFLCEECEVRLWLARLELGVERLKKERGIW